MSEEERRRKIILDSAAAMIRAIECMRNTMLLSHSSGHGGVNDEQVNRFRQAANDLSEQALDLERRCSVSVE